MKNRTGGLYINEDFESFMLRPAEEMSEAGLKKQLDTYAQGGAKTILFCGNGMRAMFDSQTFEPFWSGVTEENGKCFFRGKEITNHPIPVLSNVRNCRKLYENVKSPYDVRIRYGHEKGLKIFASMRMNDVHCTSDFDNLMNSDWWREHQDCRVAPFSKEWWGQGMDYARPEVYAHHLALAKEYVTRFDLDGLELDWMRTPYYFKPGCEEENAHILTEFLRELRACADEQAAKRGHRISLTVRVPPQPDDARRMGFDVRTWAHEKLIDMAVPTAYWGVSDSDIPVELWHALLGEEFPVAPGLDLICRSNPGQKFLFNTTEIVMGYAAAHYYRGADAIYLFNHMDRGTGINDPAGYRKLLETLPNPQKTEDSARRHVLSYLDELGRAVGQPHAWLLPIVCNPYKGAEHLRLNIGGGIVPGRKVKLILSVSNTPESVRINTVPCTPSSEKFTLPLPLPLPPDVKHAQVWECPEGAVHNGDNVVSVCAAGDSVIDWCEMDVSAR